LKNSASKIHQSVRRDKGQKRGGRGRPLGTTVRADYIGQIFQIAPVPGI
jgi:hypothetical protein